jgi:putative transposase
MGTSPKTVYRALVLKYDLNRLPPEAVEKVSALLKVQEEFRRWATEWALSGGKEPMPERIPLRHFANWFIYAGSTFDWLKGVKKSGAEVKKMRPPLIFNVQLRLGKERDVGSGVLVDVQKREVRIRKWSGQRGNTIVLPLGENAVKWIMERVMEDSKLVMTAIWVGRSRRSHAARLHVVLVFRREVTPMDTKRLLVVDFNALHNGLSWAVVEGEKIAARGTLRPDVSKIMHLQKVVARLDSLCAKEGEACDEAMAVKSRIWRIIRVWEDEAVKKLVQLAIQYKAMIVVDIPYDESIKTLKEGRYVAKRKIFLNFGRVRRRLKGLAEWYGISYREERLYSTMCPVCGRKMKELSNRRVRCACGFEAHRDEVPIFWAVKRFHELTSPFSGSTLSSPSPS